MHIRLIVYYPLFFSDFREYENWSFNVLIIHVCFWENFSLTLQDILSDPVFVFQNLCLLSEIYFLHSIENIHVC